MIACRPIPLPALLACFGLAACASVPHVTAYQEARFAPAPRSVALAVEDGEALPLAIKRDAIVQALAHAGFVTGGDAPARYRLTLTAAIGSAKAGSFIPGSEAKAPPGWVGRPDHSLRARIAGDRITRITMILTEVAADREVWRGTGTARDEDADAQALAGEILAKLPHG